MRIVSGASTDKGQVRDGNEDSYLVDRRLRLFAIADGMGGHRAGEVASATALEGLHAAVDEGVPVSDAVGRANTAVWDKAAGDTSLAPTPKNSWPAASAFWSSSTSSPGGAWSPSRWGRSGCCSASTRPWTAYCCPSMVRV